MTSSAKTPTNDTIGLASVAAAMPLPAMPAAGRDYRWLLPDDTAPLQSLGAAYSYVDRM